MDERMRFVIRHKDGEMMVSLCREFGISRKAGYKILERYEQCGLEGLRDRTRRSFRHANQLPEQVEAAIERPNGRNLTGAHARSGSVSCGACRMPSRLPRLSPFTPCSIAMGGQSDGSTPSRAEQPHFRCRMLGVTSLRIPRPPGTAIAFTGIAFAL